MSWVVGHNSASIRFRQVREQIERAGNRAIRPGEHGIDVRLGVFAMLSGAVSELGRESRPRSPAAIPSG
jgi:hypothetical protein